LPAGPAAAKAPCGADAECSGDGACINTIQSCVDSDLPGCGVIAIPGGTFKLGWVAANGDAAPYQEVTVGTFVLDKFETTVARFRAYWAAGHPAPPGPIPYPNGRALDLVLPLDAPLTTQENNSYNWTDEPGDREAHPINRITWHMAQAFCAWDGGRLPTEAEWEYAATGRSVGSLPAGRLYPWGEETPTCALAHSVECNSLVTIPVDALPPHAGLYQMAGNVWEWTADVFEEYGDVCWDGTPQTNPLCYKNVNSHTLRGGSYTNHTDRLPGTTRIAFGGSSNARGLRCARDPLLSP
jgi:formylglycine-generating enzyme required for sulfatase activity